jgi:hypothetical protein
MDVSACPPHATYYRPRPPSYLLPPARTSCPPSSSYYLRSPRTALLLPLTASCPSLTASYHLGRLLRPSYYLLLPPPTTQVMADAYAHAGFYVYPTETPETAPINLMKAQANGCIPITSRFLSSAIPETTGDFDLGPPPRRGSIKHDADWLAEWTRAVVRAVNTPQALLDDHRRRMKQVTLAGGRGQVGAGSGLQGMGNGGTRSERLRVRVAEGGGVVTACSSRERWLRVEILARVQAMSMEGTKNAAHQSQRCGSTAKAPARA